MIHILYYSIPNLIFCHKDKISNLWLNFIIPTTYYAYFKYYIINTISHDPLKAPQSILLYLRFW